MIAKKLGESFLVWIIASLLFAAAFWGAFATIATFAPSGDAAFGFSLGLIPSLIVFVVGYIATSFWALFFSYAKTEFPFQKLRFVVLRSVIIAGILGSLMVLNAVVVHRMTSIH